MWVQGDSNPQVSQTPVCLLWMAPGSHEVVSMSKCRLVAQAAGKQKSQQRREGQRAEDCELLFTGTALSTRNELIAPLRVLLFCYWLQLRQGLPSLCFHFIAFHYDPEQLKRFGLLQMNPFQTLSFHDSFKCQSVLSWWINEAYYRLC